MARKTYPNTPQEEADRINAKSGDPNGITAEQVANNRKLNESLTASFGFSNSTSGPPINPFASLVAGLSDSIQKTQEADAVTLPGDFAQAKAELDSKISRASGELGSGLNGSTGNPKGAEAFSKDGEPIKLDVSSKNDWRVRITCEWGIFNSPVFSRLVATGGVVWPYLPSITVATKAEYSTINTVHSNYTQYAYKGSSIDDIQISGEFSCETESDAEYWIAATTFFKTATKMFFGEGNLAGNPPIICILKGYGANVFNNTPIIIKSFSVDLKDDVNYVKCESFGSTTWVPVLSTISVTVSPVYTRARMRKFNLQDYSRGQLASEKGQVGYI